MTRLVRDADAWYGPTWARWPVPTCPDLYDCAPWSWDESAVWRWNVTGAPADDARTARLAVVDETISAKAGNPPGPPYTGASYGMPYQVVSSSTRTVRVWDESRPWWPLPVSRIPAPDPIRRMGDPVGGFDLQALLWNPDAQRLTEVGLLRPTQNPLYSWVARVRYTVGYAGGRGLVEWDTSRPWNADGQPRGINAANLPILPLVARVDEVLAGGIRHALALALKRNARGEYVWPARNTDGPIAGHPVRMGERLRLKYDAVTRFPPLSAARELAEAAAVYGALLVDTGGIGSVDLSQDRRWYEGVPGLAGLADVPFSVSLSDFEIVYPTP